MKVLMKLLTDTVFGDGKSLPGGEDISVLHDEDGFPYYRGDTLKGIFREELINLLLWQEKSGQEAEEYANKLLGKSGDDTIGGQKIEFSNLTIPAKVKNLVLKETGNAPETVLQSFTHLRKFTALDEEGTAKTGTLRVARCVNKGICLTGEIKCSPEQEELVKEVLTQINWVGTMRNRGFGKVLIMEET